MVLALCASRQVLSVFQKKLIQYLLGGTSGVSSVVGQLPHHSKVKASCLATTASIGQKKHRDKGKHWHLWPVELRYYDCQMMIVMSYASTINEFSLSLSVR